MKKLGIIGLALLGLVLLGLVFLDPSSTLLGLLGRESFYQGRPTRYWRQALRDPSPTVQKETHDALKSGGASATPVLAELLREGRGEDWATGVRLTAATLLRDIGPEARAAVPA